MKRYDKLYNGRSRDSPERIESIFWLQVGIQCDVSRFTSTDSVSTFRNYFLMKVDVKKREMFRQVITPQQRAVQLKFLNDLEAQFPAFETLKNTTKPLILESFFVPETIKYLTVAS